MCLRFVDSGDWWVLSQGSNGEGGEKGKKGKKRKQEKEGGSFRVLGELLFRTREEAEARLRAALKEGDNKDDRDDGDDHGDQGDDKGEGGDKGDEKEGDTGGEKRGAGSKDAPRGLPPRYSRSGRASWVSWGRWGGVWGPWGGVSPSRCWYCCYCSTCCCYYWCSPPPPPHPHLTPALRVHTLPAPFRLPPTQPVQHLEGQVGVIPQHPAQLGDPHEMPPPPPPPIAPLHLHPAGDDSTRLQADSLRRKTRGRCVLATL